MTHEEAIKILREAHDNALFSVRTALETICPELAESEDERIRKELLEVIRHCYEDGGYTLCTDDYKKYLAYLEKQKEQKPADPFGDTISDAIPDNWRTKLSTNDSSNVSELKAENMDAVEACMLRYLQSAANRKEDDEIMEDTRKYKQELIALTQKPAEWSEEDETCLENALWCVVKARHFVAKDACDLDACQSAERWLKSLRPSWKPSDEQMEALNEIINTLAASKNPHESDYLFNVLNELRRTLTSYSHEIH